MYPLPLPPGGLERAAEGYRVSFVDPSEAVARRVGQLLDEHGLRAEAGHRAEYSFETFADEAYRQRLARKAADTK